MPVVEETCIYVIRSDDSSSLQCPELVAAGSDWCCWFSYCFVFDFVCVPVTWLAGLIAFSGTNL